MTYRELNEKANRLANHLIYTIGLKRGDVAGVHMKRSDAQVVALLGLLKAGLPFLPVDASFPSKRKEYMLAQSEAKILLIESEYLVNGVDFFSGELFATDLQLEMLPQDVKNPESLPNGEDLAYILFTSGSTGVPKGVEIRNKSISHYIEWANSFYFEKRPVFPFAFCTPLTFDLTLTSLFCNLTRGDTVVIIEEKSIESILRDVFEKETALRAVKLTPSHIRLLSELKLKSTYITTIILGGESLQPDHVNLLRSLNSSMRIFNEYGPTETTIGCTVKEIIEAGTINIGTPISHTGIFILNEHNGILPAGVVGEIAVSGIGLAKGYNKLDELTNERFISLPINSHKSGIRMYKTGDIGMRQFSGELLCFGRKDNQVKIKAHRIELGEIENVLKDHPAVREALVLDATDKANETVLIAYVTLDEPVVSNQLREFLLVRLPDYMVPTHFITLERIPLSLHGKIDRKALPSLEDAKLESSTPYLAPRNALEKLLTEIWEDVLEKQHIGINDDFFMLGGDSIRAIRVCNRITQSTGEIVHITMLFESPSIRRFAESLQQYKEQKRTAVDAEKITDFRNYIISPSVFPANPIKNKSAIFLLSAPRSGSTLLRAILAGNPLLFSPPELELLNFNTLHEREMTLSGQYSFFLEGVVRAVMQIRQCAATVAFAIVRDLAEANTSIQDFYKLLQTEIGNKLLVDKSPNYAFDPVTLQRIENYFEAPKYIYLTRNPYGMIHSFEEAKMDQIFRFQHPFSLSELAELVWFICYDNLNNHLATVPAQRKLQIQYEALVENPEKAARDICHFLNIEYTSGMLAIYQSQQLKMLDGIYPDSKMIGDIKFQQHKKISAASAYAWRSEYKQDFLSKDALELAKQLGYEPISGAEDAQIIQAQEADLYVVSHAQKRIWTNAQLLENDVRYNISASKTLEGINLTFLEQAFRSLIHRHESLRTVFVNDDGTPKQKILKNTEAFTLAATDVSAENYKEDQIQLIFEAESRLPFNLETGPLFRARLVKLDTSSFALIFTIHHIIADGWTMDVLFKDMVSLYESHSTHGKNMLPPLRVQYKDYAVWEHQQLSKNNSVHRNFWLKQFEAPFSRMELKTDYPRPQTKTYNGVSTSCSFDATLINQLSELSRKNGATLFMTMLALVKTLLYRYTQQNDITVGTPFAGRSNPDLENQVGVFINLLAFRSIIADDDSFDSLLKKIKKTVLDAYNHQVYPFDELINDLKLERDPTRSPLFDVMFSLQNVGLSDVTKEEARHMLQADVLNSNNLFDLVIIASEFEDGLMININYNRDLFAKETIDAFKRRLHHVALQVADDSQQLLSDLNVFETILYTEEENIIERNFELNF
jgi:amino acid adenylation domain-containing protein